MSKRKTKRAQAGTQDIFTELLCGAADLVGRSPYPLVEAAERVGFFNSTDKALSAQFIAMREARDRCREALGHRSEQLALLNAAAVVRG